MNQRMHMVLLGPPGAGKSTISEILVTHLPLTVIATGKRLRTEIRAGSAIGRQIAPLLDQGQFAPDALIDRLMREWLHDLDAADGFMLDGYPRSPHQALALEGMLADLRRPLDRVVALDLGEAEAQRRLSGRRRCEGGGEPFTLHIDDAEAVGRCEARGGHLTMRDDDQPAVIAERLRVYERETAPLLDFYSRRGLLSHVDASGTPSTVAERVLAAITTVV